MSHERKKILVKARLEIPVARFLHYRDFLTHLYGYVKENVKPYSYIKFSEDLGFGSNNSLRLIIIGQRPLTSKGGDKISDAIGLVGVEKRYWNTLIRFNNAKRAGERESCLQKLLKLKGKLLQKPMDESRLEFFSQWYHPVIRELAARPDFEMDPKWIKSKLVFPLRLEEIKKSLELLSKLGLIHYDAKLGRYASSGEQIDTGADARGFAYIGYQQRMIELSKESIARVAKEKRELASATLSLSADKINELKTKIRALVQEAAALEDSESVDTDSVVQFNVQMFPHTVD